MNLSKVKVALCFHSIIVIKFVHINLSWISELALKHFMLIPISLPAIKRDCWRQMQICFVKYADRVKKLGIKNYPLSSPNQNEIDFFMDRNNFFLDRKIYFRMKEIG